MPRADRQQSATSQLQAKSNGKGNGKSFSPAAKPKTRANGKSTRGRRSEYNPKYVDIAEVLMREHGFTEAELAAALLVTVSTLTKWKREHPELLLAIKKGREEFDCEKVEKALRSRALGYKYTEKSTKTTTLKLGRGKEKIQVPAEEVTVYEKSLAPDVGAAIFWLTNRNPEKWKQIARTIIQGDAKNPVKHQHDGKVNHTVEDMGIVNDPARAAEVARILRASGAFDSIAGPDTSTATH